MDFSFSKLLHDLYIVHLEKLSSAFEEFSDKEVYLTETGRSEFRLVAKETTSRLLELVRNFCRSLEVQSEQKDGSEKVREAREEVIDYANSFLREFDSLVRSAKDAEAPSEVLHEDSIQLLRNQLRRVVFSLQGLAACVQDHTTVKSDAERQ